MWTWILNIVTYIAVIIVYFVIDGREMTYNIYLPLDMLLNCTKAGYYFYHYYLDFKIEKEK